MKSDNNLRNPLICRRCEMCDGKKNTLKIAWRETENITKTPPHCEHVVMMRCTFYTCN